jgi:peptide/nickel transport system permease protein
MPRRIRWWRHPSFMLGLSITGFIVALSLVSLVWTPYDPGRLSIIERFQGPSARHWLGTDQLGHDVSSMLMRGGANVLAVSLLAVLIGLVAGTVLGLLAAATQGSLLDGFIKRVNAFVIAFPAVIVAIMIAALLGPGSLNTILAVAIFSLPWFAQLARTTAIASWSRAYVTAARAMGLPPLTVSLRHVAPNIAGILLVQAATQLALAILVEAALSYLGLGAQPPTPSWGRMLYDAQTYVATAPRLAILPGLAIGLAVLGLTLIGDGLRDLTDQRRKFTF